MSDLRKDLDAVHIDKFERLMTKLGIINEFKAGKIKCKFCGIVVTQDNVHSIIKESGGIGYKLVCVKAKCINQLNDTLQKRSKN